jgi:hypothetical protein
MTIPYERTRAILETRRFLRELVNPGDTPRVPKAVRDEALRLLRHYPGYLEIELAHKSLPHLYGPVPPFSRLTGNAQAVGAIDATQKSEIGGKNDGT